MTDLAPETVAQLQPISANGRTPYIGPEIDGAELLAELVGFIGRYVVMSDAQTTAAALWVLHTHAIAAAEQTPYLTITSPEKRSGKTRLLDVLDLLVAGAWRAVSPSEAVVFRKIDRDGPTLLLDEVDAIFNRSASGERTEALRALLNAGNRRGTTVPRCVGTSMNLQDFSVFCAKALAGIGDLPDTIADRAVPIRLQRKAPGERVERFRQRDVRAEAEPLRERLAAWGTACVIALDDARPVLPDELGDRAQDAWEPLLAIAELVGGEWAARARRAALTLSGGTEAGDESIGVRLLADIRAVFDERDTDRLPTDELLEALAAIDEAPWGEWFGKAITNRGLAKLLKPYGIKSRSVRVETGTPKGFLREQFEDAWRRYLPAVADSFPPQRHNPHGDWENGESESATQASLWRIENERKPAPGAGCGVVADTDAENGGEGP